MTELTRFQRRLIRFQSPAFDFERASVALLSKLQQRSCFAMTVTTQSEWRDPLAFRINGQAAQGAHHA